MLRGNNKEEKMKYNATDDCNVGSPAREPVAAEICHFAERLAERAENMASRMGGKLSSVTTSQSPRCGAESKTESQEYPPLFSELRARFAAISSAMDQMEDTLNRTEL
jgi:hypothetical protein